MIKGTYKKMISPMLLRFIVLPVGFLVFMQILHFFMHSILEITNSTYYIAVAITSIPAYLYMVMGGLSD